MTNLSAALKRFSQAIEVLHTTCEKLSHTDGRLLMQAIKLGKKKRKLTQEDQDFALSMFSLIETIVSNIASTSEPIPLEIENNIDLFLNLHSSNTKLDDNTIAFFLLKLAASNKKNKRLKKPLRAIFLRSNALSDRNAAKKSLLGLWLLDVDFSEDDYLLAHLDFLLNTISYFSERSLNLFRVEKNLSKLIEISICGAPSDRLRSARIGALIAPLLSPSDIRNLKILSQDPIENVWTTASIALGKAAKKDQDLKDELVKQSAITMPIMVRRRAACALALTYSIDDNEESTHLLNLIKDRDVWIQGAITRVLGEIVDDPPRFHFLKDALLKRPKPATLINATRALERLILIAHRKGSVLASTLSSALSNWELTDIRHGMIQWHAENTLALFHDIQTEDFVIAQKVLETFCTNQITLQEISKIVERLRKDLASLNDFNEETPLKEQSLILYRYTDALDELFERDSIFSLLRFLGDEPGRKTVEAEIDHLRNFTQKKIQKIIETQLSAKDFAIDQPHSIMLLQALAKAIDRRQSYLGTLRARIEDRRQNVNAKDEAINLLIRKTPWDDRALWRIGSRAIAHQLYRCSRNSNCNNSTVAILLPLLAYCPYHQLERLINESFRFSASKELLALAKASTEVEFDRDLFIEKLNQFSIALPHSDWKHELRALTKHLSCLTNANYPLHKRLKRSTAFLNTLENLTNIVQPQNKEKNKLLWTQTKEAIHSLVDSIIGAERLDQIEDFLVQCSHVLEQAWGPFAIARLFSTSRINFMRQARQAQAQTLIREGESDTNLRTQITQQIRFRAGQKEIAEHYPKQLHDTPKSLIEDYEMIRPLGAGGLGVVFEARQKHLNRRVAIKFLHPQLAKDEMHRERFLREAQLMARWAHQHIVQVIDFRNFGDDTPPALILEYIDGPSLADTNKRSDADELKTVAQVASALAYAHQDEITHRDVCPDNVLLRSGDEAVLADFGIAVPHHKPRITSDGTILGRPRYMSPQQLEGKDPTPAMDIYALGILLYERLTQRRPFQAESIGEMIAIKKQGKFERLSIHKPRLEHVSKLVNKMLDPQERQRPTAKDIKNTLTEELNRV